jgi:hypothetical protein
MRPLWDAIQDNHGLFRHVLPHSNESYYIVGQNIDLSTKFLVAE